NRPPAISNGVTAQGTKALIASAAGTRIALLRSDPFATAHTTGNSRSALTPATCWAFSARSSPSTPAVFFVATLVRTATSSRTLAMSSISASRLEAISAAIGAAHRRRTRETVIALVQVAGDRVDLVVTPQRAGLAIPVHDVAANLVERPRRARGATVDAAVVTTDAPGFVQRASLRRVRCRRLRSWKLPASRATACPSSASPIGPRVPRVRRGRRGSPVSHDALPGAKRRRRRRPARPGAARPEGAAIRRPAETATARRGAPAPRRRPRPP